MCLGALVDVNEVTKQASLRDRFPGSRFHDVGASKKQSATSPNSLLTGKNTGNFDFPGPNNDAPYFDITLIRIDLLSGVVEANREFSARDQGIQFPYTVGTALASDLHLAVLMRV
jgi:hypothetical protein